MERHSKKIQSEISTLIDKELEENTALLGINFGTSGGTFIISKFKEKITYLKLIVNTRIDKFRRKINVPTVLPYVLHLPEPEFFPGHVILINPIDGPEYFDPYMGWKGLASEIEISEIPGDRVSIFREPNVQVLAEKIKSCIDH